MKRVFLSIIALLPLSLAAHETGGAHLHPHGAEWLPAVALVLAFAVGLYLLRRFAGR